MKNINTPEYFDKFFSKRKVDTKNLLRQEFYLRHTRKGRTIELGCGNSYFPEMARQKGESWGLDFSPKTIEAMKVKFPKVNYVVGDAKRTPFADKYFDTVVAGEIIEHLEDPVGFVMECCRIGRKVIISTPNLEFKDPEHLWEFTAEDLCGMFAGIGKVKIKTISSKKFPGRKYLFAICVL